MDGAAVGAASRLGSSAALGASANRGSTLRQRPSWPAAAGGVRDKGDRGYWSATRRRRATRGKEDRRRGDRARVRIENRRAVTARRSRR
jgi:hypothetical protein